MLIIGVCIAQLSSCPGHIVGSAPIKLGLGSVGSDADWTEGVISYFPRASLRSATASGQTRVFIWSGWDV